MKRFALILCYGVIAVAAASAAKDKPTRERPARGASSPVTAAPPNSGLTYDAFRVISDRNIFSSYRSGRTERTEEQQARTDVISFVGTLDSDKGTYAFFDGSDAAYRKALRAGESVGQFKIVRIASDTVEVEKDGQTMALRMTQQLRRPEGGDWRLVADMPRLDAQPATSGAANAATATIPADASGTLRRLMEQRQKQLKQ